MPKYKVEALIHINTVYLVDAPSADEAGDLVDDRLTVLAINPSTTELPDVTIHTQVIADAEAIGVTIDS